MSKEVRIECQRINDHKIDHIRSLALIKNRILHNKAIGKVIRINNAKESEVDYLVSKFSNNWKLVDHDTRLLFLQRSYNKYFKVFK